MKNSIYLRSFEPDDLERIYEWHNDSTLYQTLGGTRYFVSRKTVEKWMEQKAAFSKAEISLAICVLQTDEHIGNIYLKDIDFENRHAFLHILIGNSEYRNKGYGTQALLKLLDYAFNTLGLERIVLNVLADNTAAVKFYEKHGFVTEGRMRKHIFKEGMFKDVIIMGISRHEYSNNPSIET